MGLVQEQLCFQWQVKSKKCQMFPRTFVRSRYFIEHMHLPFEEPGKMNSLTVSKVKGTTLFFFLTVYINYERSFQRQNTEAHNDKPV